jgi:2-isopropylmalate synthase
MIRIFDTTLRDGEQAPGFSMNIPEKILMARQLERLGVDVIEAGFANASPDDFESVRQIAETCEKVEVCGLSRCHEADIEASIKALKKAKKPYLHVFIATSDLHLQYKLKITRDEAVKKAIQSIKLAKSFTPRVEFSPEDATRSDPKFLVEILTEAIKAGATTLNIPDTVGYSTPQEFGNLIKYLKENVKDIDKVIISTHCHDDLGLAVANSLAGILNGARQIECTINGIGERAGNAALEEIVMALKTRSEFFKEKTGIDTKKLLATSKLLCQITGNQVQPNKAIVGRNAFAHEAGIHQHGILTNRLTYEIMKPSDVGYKETQLILGKHSGRNALLSRFKELGIEVKPKNVERIFSEFKKLADKKKDIYDEDLILLATQKTDEKYELLDATIISKMDEKAEAEAIVRIGDKKVTAKAKNGDGPISSLYSAILKATNLDGTLKSFRAHALTADKDAVGIVNIEWKEKKGKVWRGQGGDTNVTIAAGKALIDILNRREIGKRIIKSSRN